jgi:hypothetical protein
MGSLRDDSTAQAQLQQSVQQKRQHCPPPCFPWKERCPDHATITLCCTSPKHVDCELCPKALKRLNERWLMRSIWSPAGSARRALAAIPQHPLPLKFKSCACCSDGTTVEQFICANSIRIQHHCIFLVMTIHEPQLSEVEGEGRHRDAYKPPTPPQHQQVYQP